MSRPRKKRPPVAGTVTPQIADKEDLEQRMASVRSLWREAGPRTQLPTQPQIEDLAWHISSCAAQPTNVEKGKLDASAREAIRNLLDWCNYDPCDNGLPHVVVTDRCIVKLKAALVTARPLADALPSRMWVYSAWSTWSRVARIMKGLDGSQAGTSATSHAVRFTSLAMQWVGHPAATADAISKELRNHPEFRERLTR